MVSSIHSNVSNLTLQSHPGQSALQAISALITVDNTCRRVVREDSWHGSCLLLQLTGLTHSGSVLKAGPVKWLTG